MVCIDTNVVILIVVDKYLYKLMRINYMEKRLKSVTFKIDERTFEEARRLAEMLNVGRGGVSEIAKLCLLDAIHLAKEKGILREEYNPLEKET